MDNINNNISKNGEASSSSTTLPKYRGVRKRKWGKWVSEIRFPNSRERIWLGSYDTQEKAARAFDAALYCLRGTQANFNFPENPPVIPGGESLSREEIQFVANRYANEASSSKEMREQEEHSARSMDGQNMNMDRSIFNPLSYDNKALSEYELYSRFDDGCYLYNMNGDERDEEGHHISSLWTF